MACLGQVLVGLAVVLLGGYGGGGGGGGSLVGSSCLCPQRMPSASWGDRLKSMHRTQCKWWLARRTLEGTMGTQGRHGVSLAEEVRERFMEEEDPLWKGELEWGQDTVRIWFMHPSLPTSVGFAYHPLISKNPDKSCSRHCHLCLTYRCEAQHRVRKPVPGTSALGGSCT